MSYEKKYKEALERAKSAIKECGDNKGRITMIEEIFPELKESEDEQNIKDLIDELKCSLRAANCQNDACGGGHEKRIALLKWSIAWLEKQTPVDKEEVLKGARRCVALSIMDFIDVNTQGMCMSNIECKNLEDAVVNSNWAKVYAFMKMKLDKQGQVKESAISQRENQTCKENDNSLTGEDERIKKELCKAIWTYIPTDEGQEYIVWLEKQGEQNVVGWTAEDEEELEIALNTLEKAGQYSSAKWLRDVCLVPKTIQKPNPYSGTSFDYNGHTWGMCARDNGVEIAIDNKLKAFVSLDKSFVYPLIHPQPYLAPKSAHKATNEEKVDNANKVKPKFEVDDWVVRKDGKNFADGRKTVRITRFDGERYWFDSGTYLQAEDIRLWNISDAKAGDVLAFNDGHIELIKSITGKKIEFWFCLTNGNRYEVFDVILPYTNPTSRKGATPATKVQRNLLFSKMHEAGYEWDEKRLELKKRIE